MCFSQPKIPPAPVAPPPPAPFLPPTLGKEEDTLDQAKRKKLGSARLQIPLAGNPSSGLGIPL